MTDILEKQSAVLGEDERYADLSNYVRELENEVLLQAQKIDLLKESALSDGDGARCDNCALWDENDSLVNLVHDKNEQIRQLRTELDAYVSAEEKTKKRLLESNMEADRLNKTALYKYHTELKTLKLFADKFKEVYGKDSDDKKAELIGLFSDFLKDVDKDGYLYTAKDNLLKLSETAFPERKLSAEEENFYGDDEAFDLDEAINPTGDLDLKSLLSELGVFGG